MDESKVVLSNPIRAYPFAVRLTRKPTREFGNYRWLEAAIRAADEACEDDEYGREVEVVDRRTRQVCYTTADGHTNGPVPPDGEGS